MESFWSNYKTVFHLQCNILKNDKSIDPVAALSHHRAVMTKYYYNKVRKETSDSASTSLKRLSYNDNDINNINKTHVTTYNVKPYQRNIKTYRDPESVENVQKFINEINQLGKKFPLFHA